MGTDATCRMGCEYSSRVHTTSMPRWSLLTEYLAQQDDVVVLTFPELDRIVEGLPPSATRHRAWWSGDRTHVRAWRDAGYRMASVDLGRSVTFVRAESAPVLPLPRVEAVPAASMVPEGVVPDLVLVSCVKSKRSVAAPARDLYTSPLFRGERAYAESTGVPWFILSAEHGLLAPDDEVEPYERYLPNESSGYRDDWGARVVRQIGRRYGDVDGRVVEIHAGTVYVTAVASRLTALGAVVVDRLHGLSIGQRLAWYSPSASAATPRSGLPAEESAPSAATPDVASLVADLSNEDAAVTPAAFLSSGPSGLRCPGLYSWWVDERGAEDLSLGLECAIPSGLVYAGLAGATRWPSGRRSGNNLWSRIAGMHLGRNVDLSTLRMSLTAVLSAADVVQPRDEDRLTEWMGAHLRVRVVPYSDPDTLGRVEEAVLRLLDPPLNLRGMATSPIRTRLTDLRRQVSSRRR